MQFYLLFSMIDYLVRMISFSLEEIQFSPHALEQGWKEGEREQEREIKGETEEEKKIEMKDIQKDCFPFSPS